MTRFLLLLLVALLACASGKVISGDLATVQTNIGFLAHFAFSKVCDLSLRSRS
jgi:multisubunit Na+/H+ antiporter MnhF subunit